MSRAREREAERAATAYHLALLSIGADTLADALVLWQSKPPGARGAIAADWLRQAVAMVMTRRRLSRNLAMAYYRLTRALITGTTVADPLRPDPAEVTLDMLRRQFAELAGPESDSPEDSPQEGDPQPPETGGDERPQEGRETELADDDERMLLDEIEGLAEAEDRAAREAERELKLVLDALGPRAEEREAIVPDDATDRDATAIRDEAHRRAGARQAAAAERIALNGGRGLHWDAASRDARALGYVRISRTGTPCGWCAMLISRGLVLYRSERAATFGADGDLYHDNCKCYAEPIFGVGQYQSSNRFSLNRKYGTEWPKVTAGLAGKEAVSAWRRHIRRQQRASAQAARRQSTSAQEA